MKSLELIVPPKLGPEPSQRKVGIGGVLTHRRAVAAGIAAAASKRFTDAELAAEYWRAESDENAVVDGYHWRGICGGWSPAEDATIQRRSAIASFATLPHYDEVSP